MSRQTTVRTDDGLRTIRTGTWVKRRHRGLTIESKVLEIRPDDKLVVGKHDNEPNPDLIDADDIVGVIR